MVRLITLLCKAYRGGRLTICLALGGCTNRPFYRIVAAPRFGLFAREKEAGQSSPWRFLGSAVFAEAAARSVPLRAMGPLELCEDVFGTAYLYRVLSVRREVSDGEVWRGYHEMSLQVHLDRVGEGDKDATRHFQILGKVYSVLSDKDQRAVYDEQGTVD
ncbi:hypothetical protein CB1_000386033 [Camelus ferus]|nr:hypothetical protein CB1_000386033 [Camelus ferus]